MKKIICIIILLFTSVIFAQTCNIGNEDPSGFNASNIVLSHNFLQGTKYALQNSGTLHSINLIGRVNTGQVKMAVYSDNNGSPGDLLAFTNPSNIQIGINSYEVTPVHLDAGNYWVMAIYLTSNNNVTFIKFDNSLPGYYFYMNFNQNLPVNGLGFQSQGGLDYTYFLEISCDELKTSQADYYSKISFHPNPVNDFINIEISDEFIGSTARIYDTLGREIQKKSIVNTVTKLELRQLTKGVFFIKVGNSKAVKLIKQ